MYIYSNSWCTCKRRIVTKLWKVLHQKMQKKSLYFLWRYVQLSILNVLF